VDSLAIEASILGAQGFGPLIRPGLGASQLNRIAARLAGTKRVPEPAEPLPLLGIGPDHQMLPTPDASNRDIAPPDPFLESVVAHAEFLCQVANPLLDDIDLARQPEHEPVVGVGRVVDAVLVEQSAEGVEEDLSLIRGERRQDRGAGAWAGCSHAARGGTDSSRQSQMAGLLGVIAFDV